MNFRWDGIVTSVGLLVAALFALMMVVVNYAFDAELARRASGLERAEGEVTVSQLASPKGRGSRRATIAARYEVDGQRYTVTPKLWGIEGHEDLDPKVLVGRLPVGSRLPV